MNDGDTNTSPPPLRGRSDREAQVRSACSLPDKGEANRPVRAGT
jgi:hypothetical protein